MIKIIIPLLFVLFSYKSLNKNTTLAIRDIQKVDYVSEIQNNLNVVENDISVVKDIISDPKELKRIKRKIKRNK